jgi:hypothetical protein
MTVNMYGGQIRLNKNNLLYGGQIKNSRDFFDKILL